MVISLHVIKTDWRATKNKGLDITGAISENIQKLVTINHCYTSAISYLGKDY